MRKRLDKRPNDRVSIGEIADIWNVAPGTAYRLISEAGLKVASVTGKQKRKEWWRRDVLRLKPRVSKKRPGLPFSIQK